MFTSYVYLFPIGAVTNHHKLSGLKQHKCIILTVLEPKSPQSLSCFLPEPLGENPFLALSSFQRPPTYVGPWPLFPSPKPAMVGPIFLKFQISPAFFPFFLLSHSLRHLFFSSTFKSPCDYIGSTQIIQGNLLILKFTTPIPSAKILLP